MPNARKDISREKELTLAIHALQESTRKLVMVRAETVLRVNSPLEQLVRARAAWLEDTRLQMQINVPIVRRGSTRVPVKECATRALLANLPTLRALLDVSIASKEHMPPPKGWISAPNAQQAAVVARQVPLRRASALLVRLESIKETRGRHNV